MSIIEQCIPKGVLPKKRKLPWVTPGIRCAMRKHNNLFRKSKRSPEMLNQLCNIVVSQLRDGKNLLFKIDNAKEFWKSVKLFNGKASSAIPVLTHDGETVVSDKEKADVLNHSCFNTALPSLTPDGRELDPATCPQELCCSKQEVFELLANLTHLDLMEFQRKCLE